MLRASFVCLPGIGEEAEQRLWRAGCLQWGQFEALGKPLFSKRKSQQLTEAIKEAEQAWPGGDRTTSCIVCPRAHQGRLSSETSIRTSAIWTWKPLACPRVT